MGNRRKLKGLHLNGVVFDEAQEVDTRPGADKVAPHNYPGPGAINVYRCDKCKKYRVVQHEDKGVTPMFMGCDREDCNGRGVSMMYPDQKNVPPRIRAAVRWIWYRPEKAEWKKLDPETKDHVARGGLLIREKT